MLTVDKNTTTVLYNLKIIVCGDECYVTNKVWTLTLACGFHLFNKSEGYERGHNLQLEEKADLGVRGIF